VTNPRVSDSAGSNAGQNERIADALEAVSGMDFEMDKTVQTTPNQTVQKQTTFSEGSSSAGKSKTEEDDSEIV